MFSANLSDKTGVYGFDSSNSAVSFIKFQNHIFTPPPLRRHQGTFTAHWPNLFRKFLSTSFRFKFKFEL
jgi:hypothetical protein